MAEDVAEPKANRKSVKFTVSWFVFNSRLQRQRNLFWPKEILWPREKTHTQYPEPANIYEDIVNRTNPNMDIEPNNKRMSPLMSIKHIWFTQSTKVKDIYNIRSITKLKQKQELLLDDVVKENTINLLRERKEQEKEMLTSEVSRESRTNGNIKQRDILSKHCKDNTFEKKRQANTNATENKATNCKSDTANSKNVNTRNKEIRPVESKTKISQNTRNNIKDVRPCNERKLDIDSCTRNSQKVYTNRNGKIIPPRPQTPKIKKSIEIRNIIKQSSIVQPTDQTKTLRKAVTSQVEITNTRRCSVELPQQLLHPLWRRIPHRPLYGWSEQHARLESGLYKKSSEEQQHTMYYLTESDYNKAQSESGTRFLQKPIVSNVSEVLQLLACYEKSPERLPKIHPKTEKYDESEESGYDADDE